MMSSREKIILFTGLVAGLFASVAVRADELNITHRTIREDVDPYDTRSLAHPSNRGPLFIFATPPPVLFEHKNLHLPDPTCIAGCYRGKK